MMNESQMQEMLEEIIAAKNLSSPEEGARYKALYSKMHALAELQYPPAFEFFMSCLGDPDWGWRLDCLRCLGFHYEFGPEGEVIDVIHDLLLHDPVDFVRIAAASVLGGRSKWPDSYLVNALKHDHDKIVRRAAFASLLALAHIPYAVVREEERRVEEGQVRATWGEVKRIIRDAGVELDIPE